MKTIQQLQEIVNAYNKGDEAYFTVKNKNGNNVIEKINVTKRLRKQCRELILWLEIGVKETDVSSQIDVIKERIKRLDTKERFDEYIHSMGLFPDDPRAPKLRREFLKETGLTRLRSHLKVLNFLMK